MISRADHLGVSYLRLFLLCTIATLASLARAHDPGISTAQGELRSDELVLTTGFAPADAQHLLPATARGEDKGTALDFDLVHEQLVAVAPQLWEVRSGGTLLVPHDIRVELLAGDNVSFHLVYPRGTGGASDKLTLRAPRLTDLPAGHRQFVIISDARGSVITKKLLSVRDVTIEVPLSATSQLGGHDSADSETPTFWAFIKLGVEHIWTGYDHLLFLFGLLVVCRSFRSIAGIVSCFTLAHSLTLALATLNIFNLPARLVEPAIAASIVFVGVENLWRRGQEPPGRWALTFVFGLIHGFGFASVLRDLGVGSGAQGVVMPLFSFNLGVELGQIGIAAAVLPLVWQLRKQERFLRWGVPILSGLVAVAGLYWLLQRTILA